MISLSLVTILLFVTGSTDPEIRVANRSNVPIEQIRIQFPEQTEEYGTVPPKGVTEYRKVRRANGYVRIEAKVHGEEVLIQPFDNFGDKQLKGGKYTYVLTINEKATNKFTRLKLKLVKD